MLPVEHALPNPARHPWRTIAVVAAGIATLELLALVLTASFMVVEAVAGWLVHSLALLSDAGHMLADAGALALALTAQRVASRPRTLSRTYGYRRAETLAALANGVVYAGTSNGGGTLMAFDAQTGAVVATMQGTTGEVQSPIVANGWLYVPSGSHLSAYHLASR